MKVKEEMNCFPKEELPEDSFIEQHSSITQECLKNEPSTCDNNLPCLCKECTNNDCKDDHESNEFNLNDQIGTATNLETAFDLPADHIDPFFDEKECNEQLCEQKIELTSTTSTAKSLHQCPVCEKMISSHSNLRMHIARLHSVEKSFSCSVCGKAYTQKDALKKHKSKHVPKQSRPQCIDCGARFTQVCSLKRHMRDYCPNRRKENATCIASQSFLCSPCGKSFPYKISLKIHQSIHSGEKPFNCSICGKNFNLKGNLEKHKFRHSGLKPFNCTICGKYFTQKSQLKSHQGKYASEKRKVCPDCGASFCKATNLQKHQLENCHLGTKKQTPPDSTHFQVNRAVPPMDEADWSFPLGPCRFNPLSLPTTSTWELFQKYSTQ